MKRDNAEKIKSDTVFSLGVDRHNWGCRVGWHSPWPNKPMCFNKVLNNYKKA